MSTADEYNGDFYAWTLETARLLRDSPSLKTRVEGLTKDRYAGARKQAELQTGLPLATFPEGCPFTIEQLLNDDYLPE